MNETAEVEMDINEILERARELLKQFPLLIKGEIETIVLPESPGTLKNTVMDHFRHIIFHDETEEEKTEDGDTKFMKFTSGTMSSEVKFVVEATMKKAGDRRWEITERKAYFHRA